MTVTITATLRDVSGDADNHPWVFSSALREGSDDASVVTTRAVSVTPVAGALTVPLDPGPATVTFSGTTYGFTVPGTNADLWDLIAAGVAFPPGTPAEAVEAAVTAYFVANPVPQGQATALTAVTAQAISGHSVVTLNNAGLMDYASANNLAHANRPLALTTGAWGSGVAASAALLGHITESTWSWTVGLPIWLGDTGLLTQALPNDSLFQRQIAEVINPTTIMFWAQYAIVLG
jgi:hypothetical protein